MDTNRRINYNVEIDWEAFPQVTYFLDNVGEHIEMLRFSRLKDSYRGLSRFKSLRRLVVYSANQDCLEEISDLPLLESLYISQLSATNLQCLSKCRNLRHLIIKGGTKIPSLSWLSELPRLESLLLENLKLVKDISAIEGLPHLKAFGFEGSMWTVQRVESFWPISLLLNLEALFLHACRPAKDGLQPLFHSHRLRYLEIAGRYPDSEFLALRRALPELACGWFEEIDRYGSIKACIKARVNAAVQP